MAKISIISTFSKSPISGTDILVDMVCFNYNTILSFFSHVIIDSSGMTLIIRNIEKLFQPKYENLDAKFWIQKVILKKYLKNN